MSTEAQKRASKKYYDKHKDLYQKWHKERYNYKTCYSQRCTRVLDLIVDKEMITKEELIDIKEILRGEL